MVAQSISAGAIPVVVFDLDATLFDNRVRTLTILSEYADAVESQDADLAAALRSLEAQSVDYLLADTLRVCGVTNGEIVHQITDFWRDRFFSDDYCGYDVPLYGAPEYVNACYEAGATVVYMTGRDVPGMLLGTVASLRDHGFPMGVAGVELVLKPDATMPDEAFKRSALGTLNRVGDVVAFFDNEPANCNVAREAFPDAIVVLLETQSVPGAPAAVAGVEMATDFRV